MSDPLIVEYEEMLVLLRKSKQFPKKCEIFLKKYPITLLKLNKRVYNDFVAQRTDSHPELIPNEYLFLKEYISLVVPHPLDILEYIELVDSPNMCHKRLAFYLFREISQLYIRYNLSDLFHSFKNSDILNDLVIYISKLPVEGLSSQTDRLPITEIIERYSSFKTNEMQNVVIDTIMLVYSHWLISERQIHYRISKKCFIQMVDIVLENDSLDRPTRPRIASIIEFCILYAYSRFEDTDREQLKPHLFKLLPYSIKYSSLPEKYHYEFSRYFYLDHCLTLTKEVFNLFVEIFGFSTVESSLVNCLKSSFSKKKLNQADTLMRFNCLFLMFSQISSPLFLSQNLNSIIEFILSCFDDSSEIIPKKHQALKSFLLFEQLLYYFGEKLQLSKDYQVKIMNSVIELSHYSKSIDFYLNLTKYYSLKSSPNLNLVDRGSIKEALGYQIENKVKDIIFSCTRCFLPLSAFYFGISHELFEVFPLSKDEYEIESFPQHADYFGIPLYDYQDDEIKFFIDQVLIDLHKRQLEIIPLLLELFIKEYDVFGLPYINKLIVFIESLPNPLGLISTVTSVISKNLRYLNMEDEIMKLLLILTCNIHQLQILATNIIHSISRIFSSFIEPEKRMMEFINEKFIKKKYSQVNPAISLIHQLNLIVQLQKSLNFDVETYNLIFQMFQSIQNATLEEHISELKKVKVEKLEIKEKEDSVILTLVKTIPEYVIKNTIPEYVIKKIFQESLYQFHDYRHLLNLSRVSWSFFNFISNLIVNNEELIDMFDWWRRKYLFSFSNRYSLIKEVPIKISFEQIDLFAGHKDRIADRVETLHISKNHPTFMIFSNVKRLIIDGGSTPEPTYFPNLEQISFIGRGSKRL